MRATTLEIKLDNFIHNVECVKKIVGNKKIMPIIKANAYGTYINKCLDILNLFEIVGVATVDEAISIRNIGYDGDIFVLNQPSLVSKNYMIY